MNDVPVVTLGDLNPGDYFLMDNDLPGVVTDVKGDQHMGDDLPWRRGRGQQGGSRRQEVHRRRE